MIAWLRHWPRWLAVIGLGVFLAGLANIQPGKDGLDDVLMAVGLLLLIFSARAAWSRLQETSKRYETLTTLICGLGILACAIFAARTAYLGWVTGEIYIPRRHGNGFYVSYDDHRRFYFYFVTHVMAALVCLPVSMLMVLKPGGFRKRQEEPDDRR